MQTGNSIIMHAPREAIFETAANLALWPRSCRIIATSVISSGSADRNIVVMAAVRSGIPISWTSELVIDRERMECVSMHLKALTNGMRVVWTFKETPAGVRVEIVHDLQFPDPALAPIAEPIIGGFFIHHVANRRCRR